MSVVVVVMRCGMFKVVLLFVELVLSEELRVLRRLLVIREVEDLSEILLDIFENIDDLDVYYGLV